MRLLSIVKACSSISGVICYVLLFALLTQKCFAQEVHVTGTPGATLLELKGYSQQYQYSKGQQQRADSIVLLTEQAVKFFEKEIGFVPKATLYILAPSDWKAVAARPLLDVYGFPHNIDSAKLAIAAEDNDYWRSFVPEVEKLPASLAAEVKNAYGKADGGYSMMPFFDLLAVHEFGHSYTSQAGLKMHRRWMGELFVNIMLHTYIAEVHPERLSQLITFPGMVVGAGSTGYSYTSLEDFERLYLTLGMGPQNYGWYQCRFHSAARAIYDAGGKVVLNKLWQALKTHQEDLTDVQFVEILQKEVHPSVADVYLKWNTQF